MLNPHQLRAASSFTPDHGDQWGWALTVWNAIVRNGSAMNNISKVCSDNPIGPAVRVSACMIAPLVTVEGVNGITYGKVIPSVLSAAITVVHVGATCNPWPRHIRRLSRYTYSMTYKV
jgi:hypothetical protein